VSHDDLTTRPVRWGILGAGGIASSLAADITRTDGHAVTAVAARDGGRAAEFAQRYDAPRSYGSYDDLVADDEVDVVYVATTHPFHHEQALAAIGAGKPVLVEKPLTLTAAGAREVFDAAAQAGVFAMEAMWMRTNPLVRQALDLVAGGAIGEVRAVHADFAFALDYDPGHRLFDRDNGGGALLDLGIYPATLAWLVLGRPDRMQVSGDLAPTGVDRTVAMQWSWADGATAQLFSSSAVTTPGRATISGTGGWLSLEPAFFTPTTMLVGTGGGVRRVEIEPAGYVPQIEEVGRCLRAGLLESPMVPQAETVAILELLDGVRAELGVSYPGE
jgi:predicted dehydrogenase